jgi:hypothetical protein
MAAAWMAKAQRPSSLRNQMAGGVQTAKQSLSVMATTCGVAGCPGRQLRQQEPTCQRIGGDEAGKTHEKDPKDFAGALRAWAVKAAKGGRGSDGRSGDQHLPRTGCSSNNTRCCGGREGGQIQAPTTPDYTNHVSAPICVPKRNPNQTLT